MTSSKVCPTALRVPLSMMSMVSSIVCQKSPKPVSQFSQRTAGKYVNKIWNTAHRLGFGNFFPKEKGTEVTDDHMYVYNLRQIPCVDIINYDPNCDTGFGDFWHTIAVYMGYSSPILRAQAPSVVLVCTLIEVGDAIVFGVKEDDVDAYGWSLLL